MGQGHVVLSWVRTIILLIVVVLFIVFYQQISSRVNDNTNAISTLNTQTTSLKSQLSSASQQLDNFNSQISALEKQTSSFTSQISALQSQFSSLNTQLTSLQSTVSSLSTQVTTLLSASSQTTLFSSQAISQGPGVQTLVYTFAPTYSGYIYISGSSSSATGYIMVTNSTSGASTSYTFGTGTTVTASLTAGNSYSIYFGNRDASGTITATLTGTYSGSSSTSSRTTLFSSQTISQGPSALTLVYTFAPTYSGYIYISGSSSSATGYIMVNNSTSGALTSYTFGTGTTVTASLTAGNSYSIYFGNRDASGTITATLTGTYSST